MGDYFISGFDVDSTGAYYFLAGEPTTLTKVASDGRIVFTKRYSQFRPNPIQVRGGEIVIFDIKYSKNSIIILDSDSGTIKSYKPLVIKNVVNDVWYSNSLIILSVFDAAESISVHSELRYIKMTTEGKFVGVADNCYGLPEQGYGNLWASLDTGETSPSDAKFLGSIGDTLIFFETLSDLHQYQFLLSTIEGQIFARARVKWSYLGHPFAEAPWNHFQLQDRKIHILMRKGKRATISILPLRELFDADASVER